MEDHATHIFRAERLVDVWVERNPRHLHAVLRIVKPRASSALTIWDR